MEILMCMAGHLIPYYMKCLRMCICRYWWMSSVLGILWTGVHKYHW